MPETRAAASHTIRNRFLATIVFTIALGVAPVFALSELRTIGGDPVTPGQAAGSPVQGIDPDSATDLNASKNDKPDVVEISHDVGKLPEPVRKLREKIIEAAVSGDPERLRALIGSGDTATQLPITEDGADPIEALKSISGDADGLEILSIILDLITAGYAHINPGAADEIFVWPYFAEKDLQTLSPPEKVEMLRIVTAGDLMGMQEYGGYNFFQIGITPDGRWKFLTAGE